MRRSPERAAARIARACAAAAVACMAGSALAGGVTGSLTADRTRVAEGGSVRLALTVAAPASARGRLLAQPVLPPLKRFDLVSTGQRNETVFGAGGGTYSVTFLYALRAKSEGTETIPPIAVREAGREGAKGEKKEGAPLVTVPGITLTVAPAGRTVFRWGIAVFVAAGVAAAALGAATLRRRRIAPPASAAPARPSGALEALAAMEEARPLAVSGTWGEYAARVHGAISAYAERAGDLELRGLAESIGALTERVRYARDPDAERAIRDGARRAELALKKMIREG